MLSKAREFNKRYKASFEATKIVLEKDLSEVELLEYIDIYTDWEEIELGVFLKPLQYLKFKDNLYQVLDGKGHNKQEDWTPDVAVSEFKKVVPEGVIEDWSPRHGANGYPTGKLVTYNGIVYESIWHEPNVWSPDEYPPAWKIKEE